MRQPAIFKVGDMYFGLFSGCTGWEPNPGEVPTALIYTGELDNRE